MCIRDRYFAFNLADENNVKKNPQFILKLLSYCDVLIGNTTEMAALGEVMGLKGCSNKEIAIYAALVPKENQNKDRIVIATQGKDDTLAVRCNPKVINKIEILFRMPKYQFSLSSLS